MGKTINKADLRLVDPDTVDISLLKYSELDLEAMDDWQRVNFLREWAFNHIPRAMSRSCLLDQSETFGFYTKQAPEIFNAFEHELGGVWCGGTAYALMMLYRHFGFRSISIDMGIPSIGSHRGMTHVVTLVEIEIDGQIILSVQDAYFNLTYVDALSSQPLDYFELLQRLSQGEHTRIVALTNHDDTEATIIANPADDPSPELGWVLRKSDDQQDLVALNRIRYKATFTIDLYSQRRVDIAPIKLYLALQSYPPELIYTYLYPFAVYGEEEPKASEFLRKAHSITGGVPYYPEKPEQKPMPLVSIITPCFNSAHFLEGCIKSVLEQDYPCVEHVIQDGASKDGTRELLERYSNHLSWVSEPDKGQSDGLDRAISRCRGDILLVLNADDQLLPHAASWAVEQMDKYPEAGVVYGDLLLMDENGKVFQEFFGPEYDFPSVFCVEKVIPAQAAFIRRSAMEAVGLGADASLDTCPDYEMFVRLGLAFPMVHTNGFVSRYRYYDRPMDGNTPRTIRRFVRAKHEVMRRVLDNPQTNREIIKLGRRARIGLNLWATTEARGIRLLDEAWRFYADALSDLLFIGPLLKVIISLMLNVYRQSRPIWHLRLKLSHLVRLKLPRRPKVKPPALNFHPLRVLRTGVMRTAKASLRFSKELYHQTPLDQSQLVRDGLTIMIRTIHNLYWVLKRFNFRLRMRLQRWRLAIRIPLRLRPFNLRFFQWPVFNLRLRPTLRTRFWTDSGVSGRLFAMGVVLLEDTLAVLRQ